LLFCDERAIFSRKGCEGFWDKGIEGLRDLSAVGRIIPDAPVQGYNFQLINRRPDA
jgi:hypothetical protein